jgi:hypothetical protein
MNTDGLFVAEWITPETTYLLSEDISAFEIISGQTAGQAEGERFGPICRLPQAACLEVCGDGFNDRTVKVRYAHRSYFVFLQDLDLHGGAMNKSL